MFNQPDSFYRAHYNTFLPPEWGGMNAYAFIFIYTAALILLCFAVLGIVRHRSRRRDNLRLGIFLGLWLTWAGVVGWQTVHQARYFIGGPLHHCGLSRDGFYRWVFRDEYLDANRLYEAAPVPGSAQLISQVVPGTELKSFPLHYWLFPRLDMIHPSSSPDYLVVYGPDDIVGERSADYTRIAETGGAMSLWRKKQ